jgi:hypothetical protein
MRRNLLKMVLVLALGIAIGLPGMALAITLNFDDVAAGPTLATSPATPLAVNYGGFTWSGVTPGYWGVMDNASYNSNYSNSITFPSGNNVVINEDGIIGATKVSISKATPFNFNGAFFGTWTKNSNENHYGASQITLNGYLNNMAVGSPVILSLSAGPLAWQNVNLNNIDKLDFTATFGGKGNYFLMDNVQVSSVPLPPSVWLFGSGLVGLVGLRRFRRS